MLDPFAVGIADEVAVIFVLVLACEGCLERFSAVPALHESPERLDSREAMPATLVNAVCLQKLLRIVPGILRDDRLVFAGIGFIVMLDESDVNGVVQCVVDA